MISFLKNHPFAVEAFFESSFVLTFAVPKGQLQHLIPECLELDSLNNKWAFIAIALVQTRGLRPKGFPRIFGSDFFLVGYRAFVKYTNISGKKLRGLYILKSETDKRKLELLGNIFTHYDYTTTDIEQLKNGEKLAIKSRRSDFKIEIENGADDIPLPANSPFVDWREARRFAGPLPFTFSYNSKTGKVLIVEGVRQNWTPKPIKINSYDISFLHLLNLDEAILANAFVIRDIPYYWRKGQLEQWKK